MMSIGLLLGAAAVCILIPSAVFFTEIVCACFARAQLIETIPKRPGGARVAVLVPAHNEEDGIGPMLAAMMPQLAAGDRVLVVADNCTDATAERGRAAGAEVVERFDANLRGKGYALDFGLSALAADPPAVVLILDADCQLGPGALDLLAARAFAAEAPMQAGYDMRAPAEGGAATRFASFAWMLKTHARPTGMTVLGLPCQLMGTGMAIPWPSIRRINLATGNIVEDIKMGLDLAGIGAAPVFCPRARVVSDFPATGRGLAVQRQRWETGSLKTAMLTAPRMLVLGLLRRNWRLAAMAADLVVPPLVMLLAASLAGLALALLAVVAGGAALPAAIFVLALALQTAGIGLGWLKFGRGIVGIGDFAHLPVLFLRKLAAYAGMWRNRRAGWVRTDRK
jgi:cellulose synthase/poly-beta-1,6-N-acetylglucosamine synthase-like glycosyltransferase